MKEKTKFVTYEIPLKLYEKLKKWVEKAQYKNRLGQKEINQTKVVVEALGLFLENDKSYKL